MTGVNGVPGAHRPRRASRGALGLLAALLLPWACTDATDVELLEIAGSGVLFGQVFLDLDGSGALSAGDELMVDVGVELRAASGADVVETTATDSLGVFTFSDVPLGAYRLAVGSDVLADSLEMLTAADPVLIQLGDTTQVNLGTSYPMLSLEEALAAEEGQRVFTSGIALNSRVNFGDGQVHFSGASGFLRALDVERSPVAPGDSVRILGRVVTDNGRPALQEVTPFIIVQQAVLVLPEESTTGEAASADGGALDAALVRIRDAEITDTSTTVDGDFRFWAVQGVDSVEVLVREFLALNTSVIRPDTVVRLDQLTGLLSPFDDGTGSVRWRVLPRGGTDVVLETRVADVAVAISIDTAQASLGDTVEVRVIASNAGPLTATELQVRDTVPDALTFVSSSQTAGTYDTGSGIWDIGDLASGAADTLFVRLEVTNGTPGTVANIAETLPLTLEVNPPANNTASVVLTIQ